MANVQTSDKWVAAHAFINTWLKDPTLYCNNCGQDYLQCCEAPRPVLLKRAKIEDDKETEQDIFLHCNHCEKDMFLCCENPQIGNNKDHTYALVKQNKELSKESMNEYASNKTKTMRMGISIPPRLFRDLGITAKQAKVLFQSPFC